MNMSWEAVRPFVYMICHTIALIILLCLIVMIVADTMIEKIRDVKAARKRRRQIEEYIKRYQSRSLEQRNKTVSDARQSKNSEDRSYSKLYGLAFLLGFLLGVLFKGVIA